MCVVDTGGKLATGIVDTGGASCLVNISVNFRTLRNDPNVMYFLGVDMVTL